ncbi:methyltransferase [Streptomyces sp. NPDC057638]|uniref:methyltransferase n=1 Tax=Streptomyces sp. NPDC057638 TaxID=3346190 RepID=UPI0036B7B64E
MTPEPLSSVETLLTTYSWDYISDRALHTAAELGVADHLSEGPATIETLARKTATRADALARLLRPLVANGIFGLDEAGHYTRTEFSALLESDHEESLRAWFRLMYRVTYRFLDDPLVTLRTGRTAFEERFGAAYFDHMATHPEDAAVFHAAMAGFTQRTARAVAGAYDFTGAGRMVDVGGGLGRLVIEILTRFPGATATVFDVPGQAAPARAALDAAGVGERASVASGDFFAAVPEADTHLLSWILHDWDDERALTILRRCRESLATENGRLLVVEAVLPERPAPGMAAALDLVMLFGLGGRERTEREYAELLAAAGYAHTRTTRLGPTGMCLLEATPV